MPPNTWAWLWTFSAHEIHRRDLEAMLQIVHSCSFHVFNLRAKTLMMDRSFSRFHCMQSFSLNELNISVTLAVLQDANHFFSFLMYQPNSPWWISIYRSAKNGRKNRTTSGWAVVWIWPPKSYFSAPVMTLIPILPSVLNAFLDRNTLRYHSLIFLEVCALVLVYNWKYGYRRKCN